MNGQAEVASVLIFLGAVVLLVPLARALGVSSVLGYLAAGFALGPGGLELVEAGGALHALGELGILFLLFAVGLELSFERLIELRRDALGLGTAQVLATGALLAAIATALGVAGGLLAVVVGLALAMSSTAVVLQLLRERGELAHRHGRLALAVLMLQDLAVIPLLVAVAVLASGAQDGLGGALALAVGKAGVAIVAIVLGGRFVLRPLYAAVAAARSPEVLLVLTLLLALGTGVATQAAGLSMSLGAFLAGLLVGETEYRHQVEADIEPFRALLLGLFFAGVGLSIDVRWLREHLGLLALAVLAVIALKASVVAVLARVFGHPWRRALYAGLLLAQVGELGLVALNLAGEERLLDAATASPLLTLTALSMAITPALAALGRRLDRWLAAHEDPALEPLAAGSAELEGHTIVAGCGRVGHTVCRVLLGSGIAPIGLELDPARVAQLRREGIQAFVADATRPGVLEAAGIGRARALVVTVDDAAGAERICSVVHRVQPGIVLLARARTRGHGRRLVDAGASAVVAETLEGSLELAGRTLAALDMPADEINRLLGGLRQDDYALLDAWQVADGTAPRAASP
jgi:CPA2 family monovalent cation:H+ antiporter-2